MKPLIISRMSRDDWPERVARGVLLQAHHMIEWVHTCMNDHYSKQRRAKAVLEKAMIALVKVIDAYEPGREHEVD